MKSEALHYFCFFMFVFLKTGIIPNYRFGILLLVIFFDSILSYAITYLLFLPSWNQS